MIGEPVGGYFAELPPRAEVAKLTKEQLVDEVLGHAELAARARHQASELRRRAAAGERRLDHTDRYLSLGLLFVMLGVLLLQRAGIRP